MRTCELGHENPDDASRCSECLRRLTPLPPPADDPPPDGPRASDTDRPEVVDAPSMDAPVVDAPAVDDGGTPTQVLEPVVPVRDDPAPPVVPVPEPATSPPTTTDRDGRGSRRRTHVVALAAVLGTSLLVVVLVLALRDPPAARITPDEAFALAPAQARVLLDEVEAADAERRSDLLEAPGWLVQLSGKCTVLTEVDLTGPSGFGVPDGITESYSEGVGANGVLAFHLGARAHWGDSVLLARGEDLRRELCPDGEPLWLTFDAPEDGPFARPGDALCECATRGLPFRECGATPTDGSAPIFWVAETEHLACP